MIIRRLRRLPLPALLLATCIGLAATSARAEASLLGTWVLDEAALRADVDAVVAEQFQTLPTDARAQAEQAMRAEVDRIVQTAAGTIQFRADGTATSVSAAGLSEWVWTSNDGVVRLEKKEALVSDVPLLGTIVNDALYLEPDVAGEPGLPLPLKRAPSAPGDDRG
ncbi:hypothetical protein [Geminicoccus harenae]|uniref:hypothetical protein n=2 Tax=Geminicoccus harenae TaxID=2498453 RepID=UPI001C97241B|nr:hypothetical protein [Geminicoccus harenae]